MLTGERRLSVQRPAGEVIRDCDAWDTRRNCRLHACERVLDREALCWRHAKPRGRDEVKIRTRLSARDIIYRDDGIEVLPQVECVEDDERLACVRYRGECSWVATLLHGAE